MHKTGYIVEESRDPDACYADDVTLDWMIRRTKHFYPDFPFDIDHKAETRGREWAALHNSRRGVYFALPLALRSIANSKTGVNRWLYQREVSRDRHARPIGEMIHISALERLLPEKSRPLPGKRYKAANLANVKDWIKKTYEPKLDSEGELALAREANSRQRPVELPVVDWDGSRITGRCHRAEYLRQLLAREAEERRLGLGLSSLWQAVEAWRTTTPSARL
jgi:hypothetical protein